MVTIDNIFDPDSSEDITNLDYGESLEHLQVYYIWDKTAADLVGNMPTWLKTLR